MPNLLTRISAVIDRQVAKESFLTLFACCVLLAGLTAGCGTFGNGAPPTALEAKIFNTTTNYVPIVQVVTNYQVVTVVSTNVIPVTNTVGVVAYATNVVTVQQTNAAAGTVTNLQPQYVNTPNATAGNIAAGAGMAGSLFGWGGIASTAVTGIFTLWGWLRSAKNYNTAANTTQVVEVLRSFIQQLPNGAAWDNAFSAWMQQHQAQAGVLNNVLNILETQVSNPVAKTAAAEVQATMAGLGITIPGQTTPVKTA